MEVYSCPYCQGGITIEQINCGIFRHGIYRSTGLQMNPHTPQQECERLVQQNVIWGCGRPFRFDGKTIQPCDYL